MCSLYVTCRSVFVFILYQYDIVFVKAISFNDYLTFVSLACIKYMANGPQTLLFDVEVLYLIFLFYKSGTMVINLYGYFNHKLSLSAVLFKKKHAFLRLLTKYVDIDLLIEPYTITCLSMACITLNPLFQWCINVRDNVLWP